VLAVKPDQRIFSTETCGHIFAALKDERRFALAVSGGSDSMAMLHLATLALQSFCVLTVDHGLRAESAAEAQQVAVWCEALGIEHHILQWEGDKPKTGLQAKARKARYDLMTDWCKAHDIGWLLTAHTLDDQAETVVMRQARTNTDESLAAIWQCRDWNGVKIHRPLLDYRRADLHQHLLGVGQPWIEDPSNWDERFERVRVRKSLVNSDERILELAQIARDAGKASRILSASARDWLMNHLEVFPEGYGIVRRGPFLDCDPHLQRRLVQDLIMLFGGETPVDPSECGSVASWIERGGGSRRTLGGAIVASRKDNIVFGREAGRISDGHIFLPASGEILWDGRFQIIAEPGARVVPVASVAGLARRKDLPAVVQSALPVVLTAKGEVIVPHLGIGSGATAKFMRRLR
jgi:tRNA(Ile)-lysidine synthase